METDTVERFENHTNNTKEISYLAQMKSLIDQNKKML